MKHQVILLFVIFVCCASFSSYDQAIEQMEYEQYIDSLFDENFTYRTYHVMYAPDDTTEIKSWEYEHNWQRMANSLYHVLLENHYIKKGAELYYSMLTRIDPFEIFKINTAIDTIYMSIWSNIESGNLFVNIQNNDLSESVTFYENPNWRKKSKLYKNEYHKENPTEYDYREKLLLNWDIATIINESKAVNKVMRSSHTPPTITLLRITLHETSSYSIDITKYLDYIPLTEEDWEDQKAYLRSKNMPIPEIDDKYIH